MDCEQKQKRTWFDPRVSLGNLLTLLVFAVAIFGWATTVEKTLAVHTVRINNQDERSTRMAQAAQQSRAEIRESLNEIKSELRDLSKQIRQEIKR